MPSWKELWFGKGGTVHGNPCWVTHSPEGRGLGMNPQKGRNKPTESAACVTTEVLTTPEGLGPMKGPLPGQGNPEVYSSPWMLHTGAQEIIKKWEGVQEKSKIQRVAERNGCALTSTSCIASPNDMGRIACIVLQKQGKLRLESREGRW